MAKLSQLQKTQSGEGSSDGGSGSQPSSARESTIAEETAPHRREINISSSTSTPSSTENPFAQLGIQKSNGETPRINIKPSGGKIMTPMKRPSSNDGRQGSGAGDNMEEWEDRILCSFFRITLDPSVKTDHHGHPLHFVKGVRTDFEEQGQPIRLSTAMLGRYLHNFTPNFGQSWKHVPHDFKFS